MKMGKKLLVYYSYTNNTKKLAEEFQKELGCDIAEIEPIVPYSDDYETVVNQGKEEAESGYEPAIKETSVNIDEYDTIILGMPVWWYTFAPPVKTFLNEYNFDDKTIIPFATNGGWIGHTFKDIEKMCPNSKVINPMNIKFSKDTMKTSSEEIENWLKSIKNE